MQSIINFNKVHKLVNNDLNYYSDETINIISDIIEGNFESYHALSNTLGFIETKLTLNKSQNYYGVIENYVGLYYAFVLNNYELAEKYYMKAIDKGCNAAASNLANIYTDQQKYDLAEKYYIMASDKGNNIAAYNLADLYGKQQKYDLAEKYYIMAIEKGVSNAANNLAVLYEKQQKYELAEKYYTMAIDKDNAIAMNNLANMYEDQQKYDLAEKYYLMAIENGDAMAMNNLANMYFNHQNYEFAETYFVMAIKKGNKNAIRGLEFLFKNDIRYFLCLTKINCTSPENDDQIKLKLNELMKNKSIYCFSNRLILNTKYEECPICMISQSLIPYDCSHFLCPTCYTKINKCPICKYPDI